MKSELTSDQELVLEKNLVWIFASPRSGTTWLSTQLLSGLTKTMDEPRIGTFIVPTLQELSNNRKDYFFSDDFKKTWSYFLRKLILNRIYSQFKDLSKTIIIKEPNASLASPKISESLPNSKFLIILRDGRDVIDSLVSARTENGWVTKYDDHPPLSDESRLSFIQLQCKTWVKTMEIIMKAYNSHPKGLRHLVKYEDLRNNTPKEFEKILRFLGISKNQLEIDKITEKFSFEKIPAEDKGKGKQQRSATPGKWKENFSEEEKALIKKLMDQKLREFGYE